MRSFDFGDRTDYAKIRLNFGRQFTAFLKSLDINKTIT